MKHRRPGFRRTLVAAALLSGGIAAGLLLGERTGAAQGVEATWSLSGRSDATSFRPGSEPPADHREGFGIVSLAATGPVADLSGYRYSNGNPPFPTCDAILSESIAAITLEIGRGYPYAGCVFFLGVANTGERSMKINLGALEDDAGLFCTGAGCTVEIVAGGPDATTVAQLCSTAGSVAETPADDGLTFELQPGAVMTCPLFVVIRQPAGEGTRYTVTVRAPTPAPGDATGGGTQPPPPLTGTGLVVRPENNHSALAMRAGLFLASLGAIVFLMVPGRRRGH